MIFYAWTDELNALVGEKTEVIIDRLHSFFAEDFRESYDDIDSETKSKLEQLHESFMSSNGEGTLEKVIEVIEEMETREGIESYFDELGGTFMRGHGFVENICYVNRTNYRMRDLATLFEKAIVQEQAHSYDLIYTMSEPALKSTGTAYLRFWLSRCPEDQYILSIEIKRWNSKRGYFEDWETIADVTRDGTIVLKNDEEYDDLEM